MVTKFLKSSVALVLNKTDSSGRTGLHLACSYGCQEVVRKIVAKKESNVNIKSNDGRNALAYCMNDERTAKIILESEKLKISEMNGVEHFLEHEDGSIAFHFKAKSWKDEKWLTEMNSEISVEKICD